MSETGKLAGKRALVAGAGTGIGLEIAMEFCAPGRRYCAPLQPTHRKRPARRRARSKTWVGDNHDETQ
jgi:NAD(P)-dependent dehydrogenase (short-subunit alcohol dehydrogenase family)